jgi:hypothetical protein
MKIVRSGEDGIAAAERALAETEARIATLEAEWPAKIAEDGDYVAAVTSLDRELATLRANATLHRERIMVLREKQKKVNRALREQQKVSGIAAVKKLLSARSAAAAKLDRALQGVAEAFAELEVADKAIFADWPDVLMPARRLDYLSVLRLDALSSMRKQRPIAPGVIRQILEKLPFDFGTEVDKRNDELIDELTAAPISDEQEAA